MPRRLSVSWCGHAGPGIPGWRLMSRGDRSIAGEADRDDAAPPARNVSTAR